MSVDVNTWNNPVWQNGRAYGYWEGYARARSDFPPLPPVPRPDPGNREISRFWYAIALLGATLGSLALKAPDWLISSFATGTLAAGAWYFKDKTVEALRK